MKNYFSCFLRCFILLTFAPALQGHTAPYKTAKHSSVRLPGHVPAKIVSDATFIKRIDADISIPVTFLLPLRNKEALEMLVERIHDPMDHQNYGNFLSSEEFIKRFAPTQEDYEYVVAYAKSLGLTVTGTHSNRTLVNVSGPAGQIEKAFNLRLHHYKKQNGRTFYAPNDNPEVPVAIASIIHGIVGLDNHAVRHTYNRRKQMTEGVKISRASSNTSPSGPGGGYAPNDLLTAYNLSGVSANGSNQIIALFELAAYRASDIHEYTNYFGLPQAKLNNILVDGGSGSGIDAEVTLDIQLALALAPESQIYIYEGPNSDQGVLDTYNRIATDNVAKQVSTSWGMGENLSSVQYLQAENAIFLQMAAHGQTIYAAAGDSGAYDDYPANGSLALVVDDPASQPYVVGVGGTRLTVNSGTGAYKSEKVWNDGLGNGAGGGGVSSIWPIPSWQKNISTTFSKTSRNVPDVSLNADEDTGYSIFFDGQWTIFGGTSCAAPLWAAFTARVNQERLALQKPVLGFANPSLYAIGAGSTYNENFHDITKGNNLHYVAGIGYDNASGWGSFNGANLFASLTSCVSMSPLQLSPLLAIAMSHTDPLKRGEMGTYTIAVPNHGSGSTLGTVNVVISLPKGLTYKSLSGSGWTVDYKTLTCTRSSILEAGLSYPPITLKVLVDVDAPNSVAPTATVSGGGSANMTITNLTQIEK
jgi:kumamolisin